MTKEERIKAEYERLAAMHAFERETAETASYIFGIDEAGRGPLCGPVVAACCIMPEGTEILYLNDSKKLSEKKRELLYTEIIEKCLAYGIGMSSPSRIDDVNILNATLEAMRDAFKGCIEMYNSRLSEAYNPSDSGLNAIDLIPSEADSIVLVDGNRSVPGISFRQKTIIGGDAKCPSISAASIIAKVTRDHMLLEYDRQYPEYGFARHKGYGTKEHIAAIKKYGLLDIHRRSFLKNIIDE